MILDNFRRKLDTALRPWIESKGVAALPAYALEEPPAGIEADVACNIAMLLSKSLKMPPRVIAQEIVALLAQSAGWTEVTTIAGAGFINFQWPTDLFFDELVAIRQDPSQYGRLPSETVRKVLVEFVSANPTGPLHVGHGRGAALGDSLALILSHLGHSVVREYYINDAGNQVQLLGESLIARSLELQGKPFELPVEGYHGDYVRTLAEAFNREQPGATDLKAAIRFALQEMQKLINLDLADFGVRFDSWFSEASVVEKGLVDKHVEQLKKKGFIEEAEDALWFVAPDVKTPSPILGEGGGEGRSGDPHPASGPLLPRREKETPEGRDKNRVLKRRDGRWTYFATDIAYHADKFERGYDELIDIWGADHHGYVPRVKGSMQALGYDPERLHIVLYQLVSLMRGGVPVSMSKRSGDFITLREVLNEVGRDACRFFFAMRGPNTALEFDLELAKKHSNDNPVYYLQYAHARICSIFRQAPSPALRAPSPEKGEGRPGPSPFSGEGGRRPDEGTNFNLLTEKEERDLLKRLSFFPQALRVCAQEDSPHPLANYLLLLCRQFHHFYDHHRVLGVENELSHARLALLEGVRQILRLGLKLLGVSAPETM